MASHPDLKHGRWDLEQFWRLGEDEITRVMSTAATLGYPAGNDTALDFGCGVGRLTRAMACHFSHSTGVDVAETMIEQATRLDDGAACTFVVNQTNDLARFGDSTFDFVYSALVLQHLPTVEVIRGFIAEFLRVLKPDGLFAFQLPTRIPPPTCATNCASSERPCWRSNTRGSRSVRSRARPTSSPGPTAYKTRTASHLLVHAFGFGGQRPVGERPPDCDRLQPTDLPVCARDGWLAAAKDLLQHPGERPGMACDRFMIAGNGHRARAELPGQRVGGLVHHLPRP